MKDTFITNDKKWWIKCLIWRYFRSCYSASADYWSFHNVVKLYFSNLHITFCLYLRDWYAWSIFNGNISTEYKHCYTVYSQNVYTRISKHNVILFTKSFDLACIVCKSRVVKGNVVTALRFGRNLCSVTFCQDFDKALVLCNVFQSHLLLWISEWGKFVGTVTQSKVASVSFQIQSIMSGKVNKMN